MPTERTHPIWQVWLVIAEVRLADLWYGELHVALATADPHISKQHIFDGSSAMLLTGGSDRVWSASLGSSQDSLPLAGT